MSPAHPPAAAGGWLITALTVAVTAVVLATDLAWRLVRMPTRLLLAIAGVAFVVLVTVAVLLLGP